MLEVGNGQLTLDENRSHMSLWCLLSAPLLAGNDLTKMKPETLAILTDREVVGLDQDPAGKQGYRVSEEGPLEVWMKPLADGRKAVGLFNRGESTMPVTVKFHDIGASNSPHVRDLWSHKDLGAIQGSYTAQVPSHGVTLITVK